MKRGNHRVLELVLFIVITFLFSLMLQPSPTGFAAVVTEDIGFTDPVEKPGTPEYSEKPAPKETPKEGDVIEKPVEETPSKEPVEEPPSKEQPPPEEDSGEEPPETRSGTDDQEEETTEETFETPESQNDSELQNSTNFETTGNVIEKEVFTAQAAPSISSVFLNASSNYNTSVDNLTVKITSSDSDGDYITNITDWRVDGTSIAVLNMPFDTNSSSTVKDYSSYGNDGSITGPAWTDKCVGGCYNFDGTDDYFLIPHNDSLNLTSEFTFSGWINTDVLNENNWFVVKRVDAGSPGWSARLNSADILDVTLKLKDGTELFVEDTSTTYAISTWYHVAFTANNNTKALKLFINGVLKDVNISSSTSGFPSNITNLTIGTSIYYPTSSLLYYGWNGLIDEITIYNRVLSEDQISELYLAGFNNHSLEKIVGEEINHGENWTVNVTVNDNTGETSLLSNDVITTLALNFSILLNATSEYNFSTDNLTAFINETSNPSGIVYTNITDWRVDGNSILVLNYPFDTDYEYFVKDYSSYGNNETLGEEDLNLSPQWTSSGFKGGAYIFDGINDYIKLENFSNLSDSITLSAWVNSSSEGSIILVGDDASFENFFEGWESGSISSNWFANVSGSGDDTVATNFEVLTSSAPHTGSYHLLLDNPNGQSQNMLKTNFSMENSDNITLTFWHFESGEDSNNGNCANHTGDMGDSCDGVFYTCNGNDWIVIDQLSTDEVSYTKHTIDLTSEISSNCGGKTNSSFAIKFVQEDNVGYSSDGRFFDDINITSNFKSSLILNTINGGEVKLGTDNITYSGDLNDEKWHLLTGTFNGSNLSLYVDGSYYGSLISSKNLDSASPDIFIGRNTTGEYFNGTLDEVRIYDRALSAEQISLLFQNRSLEIFNSEISKDENWKVISTASVGSEDVYSAESNTVFVNENVCDSGNKFTTCYINTEKVLNGSYSFKNLIIQNNGVLTHDRNENVIRTDAFNSVKKYWLEINASNLTIDSGGLINVSGKGYSGGDHSEDNGTGYGPGGGDESSMEAGGGGGYGGQGGEGYNNENNEGSTYGNKYDPSDLGSGGGSGDGRNQSLNSTGRGGGLVIINIINNLTVNGEILASGSVGLTGVSSTYDGSGGGSGGTISINTNILEGSGNITAVGGDGGEDLSAINHGGGGGGGRIKLGDASTDISKFTGQTNVSGGTSDASGSTYQGSEGTVYSPDLVIENGDTETLSTNLSFNSIVLSNGVLNIQDGNTITTNYLNLSVGTVNNNGTLTVNNNAIVNGTVTYNKNLEVLQDLTITGSLTHSSNDDVSNSEADDGNKTYWLNITAGNLTIDTSGEINVDEKGYYGGTAEDDGRGVENGSSSDGGGGQRYLSTTCSGGSGGGFGGVGGDCEYRTISDQVESNCGSTYGGIAYGSATNVEFLGSGGAAPCFGSCDFENSADGGEGGGLVILEIKDILNVTGNITSEGRAGTLGLDSSSSVNCSGGGSLSLGSGGGSGGGIGIKTKLITGSGLISVKGGNTNFASIAGGGGAGGRILISYSGTYLFTGTTNVTGGNSYGSADDGGNGSFFKTSFPLVRTVKITPTTYSEKVLKGYCNATEESGNPVSYSWKWYVDDILNESGTTSSYTEGLEVNIDNVTTDSSIHKNWTFSCNANTTTEAYWKNSTSFRWWDIPNITTVRITPTTAYTDSTLLGYCNTSADPDSDSITYNWKWYNESVLYNSGSESGFSTAVEVNVNNLTANVAKKYQNWTFSCMANDSFSGDWMNSSLLTILNKPPEQPTLNLTEPIFMFQTLNATANTTDADNDEFNFTFSFYNLNDSKDLNVIFSTGFESGVMNSQLSNLSNYTGVVSIVDNESCRAGSSFCGEPFRGNYQLRMDMGGGGNQYHHNILYWNNNSISDYEDIQLSFYIKDHGEESQSCSASYANINSITDCDGVFVKCSDNTYKLVEDIDISSSNNGIWYYKTYNISQNATDQCGGDGKAYGWAITKYDDASITGETSVDGFTIDDLHITGTGPSLRTNYTIQLTDAHDTIRVRTYANDTENTSLVKEQNITVSNTPPSQDTTIPNQSWTENTNLTLNMTDYFSDLDEDDVNYTVTSANNLSYHLNNITKIITIIPDTDFYGTRLVNFTANDTRNTTVSNNVNLTIYNSVTSAILDVQNITITDFSSGTDYTFKLNVTANNTGFGIFYDPLIYNSVTPSIIESVQSLNNCNSQVLPNNNCTVEMNITIKGSAGIGSSIFTWRTNWTNNDTSKNYITKTSKLTIAGNPVMELDNHTLLHDTNISSSKIFNYVINSTGNEDLNHVNLTVNEVESSWFKFNSTFITWNQALTEWDPIQDGFAADLEVNVTVNNFTNGTFTGYINITTSEGLNDSINITVIVNPEMSTHNISATQDRNSSTEYLMNVSSVGNAKLVNVNLTFINKTLNESLVSFNNSLFNLTEDNKQVIPINITLPEFFSPGNYSSLINVSPENVPSQLVNISIEVPTNTSWYFTPTTNQSKVFGLNTQGNLANLTIKNNGNVPLNFTVSYDNIPGTTDQCTTFECIDENIIKDSVLYNPTSVYIDKNASYILKVWVNDISGADFTTPKESGVKINISNSTASPIERIAYMFFNVTDTEPVITSFKKLVNGAETSHVELNKNITFEAIAQDDVEVNETARNWTINGTNYNGVFINWPESSGYSDAELFNLTYETNTTGNHSVYFQVFDTSGKNGNITEYFMVHGNTSLSFASSQVNANNVTSLWGENITFPVNVTNSGYATAYNVNLTGTIENWNVTGNFLGNISVGATKETNLTIEIPSKTVGLYTNGVRFITNFTNADGTNDSASSTTGTLLVEENHYYTINNFLTVYNVTHGELNITNFTITAVGNDNTRLLITPDSQPENITIELSKNNSVYSSSLDFTTASTEITKGQNQTIFIRFNTTKGQSPGTYSYNLNFTGATNINDKTESSSANVLTDRSWNVSSNELNVSRQANETGTITDLIINNLGNTELNFTTNISGNVSQITTNLNESLKIQKQESKTVQINYTAPDNNTFYNGTIFINNTVDGTNDSVSFNFRVLKLILEILKIDAPEKVVANNPINTTVKLTWTDANHISENTTYRAYVNNTACSLFQTDDTSSNTTLRCYAPSTTDGVNHTLKITANYTISGSDVTVSKETENAVFYKDVTNPVVNLINLTDVYSGTDVNITVNTTDNTAVTTVNFSVALFGGGTYTNDLSSVSTDIYTGTVPSTAYDGVGLFEVTVYATDSENNTGTGTGYFEVRQNGTFQGQLIDQNNNPVLANFSVNNTVKEFYLENSTNSTGHYNFTIPKRQYITKIQIKGFNFTINNADFRKVPSNFLTVDTLLGSETAGQLQGSITGIAFDNNFSSNGTVIKDYNSFMSDIAIEDDLRIYQCNSWNYTSKSCLQDWNSLTTTIDKINKRVTSTFDTFANGNRSFVLAQQPESSLAELTLDTTSLDYTINHSQTASKQLTVQSTGTFALIGVLATCVSGTVCNNFTVDTIYYTQIPAGSTRYMDVNITVPKHYPAGTYIGALKITSNDDDQQVLLTVTVPEDKSYNASLTNDRVTVGSQVEGVLGYLNITNVGNTELLLNITTNLELPSNTTVSRNTTNLLSINYTAPDTRGFYTYPINLSYDKNFAAYINVTSHTKIISISPSTGIEAGDTINITHATEGSGTLESFKVFIDGSTCQVTSGTSNPVQCTAPTITTGNLTKNLTLKAVYDNSHSYDYSTVTYLDVFGPTIVNYTDSFTPGSITLKTYLTDETGIGSSTSAAVYETVSPYTEREVTNSVSGNLLTNTLTITTENDYNISYSLVDTLGNTRNLSRFFEVFNTRSVTGSVKDFNGNSSNTSLTLYRWEGDTKGTNITIDSDGDYTATIPDRLFSKASFNFNDFTVSFINTIASQLNENFVLEKLNTSAFSIGGTGVNHAGIAGNISLSNSVSLEFSYDTSLVNDPTRLVVAKCVNWSATDDACFSGWTSVNTTLDQVNNKITANVTNFSAYVLTEHAAAGYVIGDGICTISLGESFQNSPEDCAAFQNVTQVLTLVSTSSTSTTSSQVADMGNLTLTAIEELLQKYLKQVDEFAVDTARISRQLYPGEITDTKVGIVNGLQETAALVVQLSGEITDFLTVVNQLIEIPPGEKGDVEIRIAIPYETKPRMYQGDLILLLADAIVKSIPVEIRVLELREKLLDLKITPLQDRIPPGKTLKIQADVYNLGMSKRVDVQLLLELVDQSTLEVLSATEEAIAIETTISVIKTLKIPEDVEKGRYVLRGTATYPSGTGFNMTATSLATVVVADYWYNYRVAGIIPLWVILGILLFLGLNFGMFEFYEYRKRKKARYKIQIDYSALPKPEGKVAFIGNIAETSIRTFIELEKLKTHTIVAGATGGGKTVAAQDIAEEALKNNTAVIVFDPTAQWTGFLRKSENKPMLKLFHKFQMKRNEARAFNGNVHVVENPRQKVSIKKYMKPGEIHVFVINKLSHKDVDLFIANTIRQVFRENLPESPELKLLMVYDEVHRLLPKFGGSGSGFLQIERGAREFRKWGVGLVLISQVLSDFIGEIKANISTEIQMKTKDEGDLERIKTKYGIDIMQSLIKAGTGTGMVENADYNKGRAYFVNFRPLLHNIERLDDQALSSYAKYNTIIEDIEYQLEELEKEKVDVFDVRIELNLASEKLKAGNFNMVQIYLESVMPRVEALWKGINKAPKKKVLELVEDEELLKEVEQAKKEREEYLKKTGHEIFNPRLLERRLRSRNLYVVEEKKNTTSLKLVRSNLEGRKLLTFTRENPDLLPKEIPQDKSYWITLEQGKETLSPTDIDKIYRAFVDYILKVNNPVVLFDAFLFVMKNTSFDRAIYLLDHMKDKISTKDGIILVPVDTDTLTPEQKEQLETEFSIIHGWTAEKKVLTEEKKVVKEEPKGEKTLEDEIEELKNSDKTKDLDKLRLDSLTNDLKTARKTKDEKEIEKIKKELEKFKQPASSSK